eukprot:gb/GFBE01072007.1/.p1 GENE.gb/GFBE01072007.1/~~gb/GFBE01072007.1/.p1  ORF type:complete len:267 (+),score=58.41 gb/GFBE01072007.1/:1-801(+)
MPEIPGALALPKLTMELDEVRRQLPNATKGLRACLQCRIILSKEQFYQMGCPNCRDSLNMKESEARVAACTTPNFQGFLSLVKPGAFVSRFNGLENRPPGCYALMVHGELPEYIAREREESEYAPSEVGGDEEQDVDEGEDEVTFSGSSGPPPVAKRVAEKQAAAAETGPTESEAESEGFDLSGILDSPLVPPSPGPPTPAGPGTPAGAGPMTPAGAAPITPAGPGPQTPAGPQPSTPGEPQAKRQKVAEEVAAPILGDEDDAEFK